MAVDAHVEHADAESIQLDDVLDAAFLDDAGAEPTPAAATEPPADDAAAGVASGPSAAVGGSVGRWDLMSVGAFRQTREAGWEGRHHSPGGAQPDFGAALRPAPIGAMLWQQGSRGSGGVGGGVKGIKHAKRRRMMLGAAGMSSPLILPSVSASPSLSSTSKSEKEKNHHHHHHHQNQHSNHNQQNQEQQQQQKSRREQRRERKVQKKALKAPAQHAQHLQHSQHSQHQFHAHAHHPNSKLRGAGAAQRANFFGGAVPVLNL